MKNIFLTLVFILAVSCTNQNKAFFDFDHIDHYHINVEYDPLLEMYRANNVSDLKWNITTGHIPQDVPDGTFINKLEEVGYTKLHVDNSKYPQIANIFKEKISNISQSSSCEHLYRDILVFRKKSEIIGLAKICFSCGGYHIVGTDANTENFGQDGDYERLEKLLETASANPAR